MIGNNELMKEEPDSKFFFLSYMMLDTLEWIGSLGALSRCFFRRCKRVSIVGKRGSACRRRLRGIDQDGRWQRHAIFLQAVRLQIQRHERERHASQRPTSPFTVQGGLLVWNFVIDDGNYGSVSEKGEPRTRSRNERKHQRAANER